MVGSKPTTLTYKVEDHIDTQYDRWIVSEMDNHQLVWVVLKYEFIDNRPTFGEDQDENEDKKTITMKVVNNLKLIG